MLKEAATASYTSKGNVPHFYQHRNRRKFEIYHWSTARNLTKKGTPSQFCKNIYFKEHVIGAAFEAALITSEN